MKKYIAPSLQVVNIQNENILAGSQFGVDKGDNGYTGNQFNARGHRGLVNDFDDEED